MVNDNGTGGYVAFQVLSVVPISFKQPEYVISEGTTGRVTLVAEQPPVVEARIRLTALSGTVEYRLSTTFITFNPGQSEASFEVSIVDDVVFQAPREFSLSIVPLNNSALGEMHEATIRVENDDVKISLTTPSGGNSLTVTEGSDLSATLRLDIDPPVNRELSVNLSYTGDVGALTGALSSVDTPEISTVITVSANTAVHNFAVMVKDDQIAAEPIRTATILLEEGPGYLVLDTDNSTVKISVADDDVARVSFSQSTGTVTEGSTIVFIITQNLITDIATSVNITFTPMGDFFKTTPITTQVDFPAGIAMSTAKITIETVNDADVEADGSLRANIMIILGSPLRPGDPEVRIVTILNDDVPAAISFGLNEYTIIEGFSRTITLRAEPPPLVKIQIELTTLSATTVPAGEYSLSTTIITFEADQPTASFEVSIPARNGPQDTQELHLSFNLRDTTNSMRGDVFETVISVEDDLAPIASLEVVGADTLLLEGGDNATLRVTLDRAFDQETSIRIVTGGTATLGEDKDYTIDNQVVTLPRNSTYVETILVVNDDFEVESDETIILRLDAHNNQIIDDLDLDREPLTLTIADNDIPAAIMFEQAAYTIMEGTSRTITLRADPPPLVNNPD